MRNRDFARARGGVLRREAFGPAGECGEEVRTCPRPGHWHGRGGTHVSRKVTGFDGWGERQQMSEPSRRRGHP